MKQKYDFLLALKDKLCQNIMKFYVWFTTINFWACCGTFFLVLSVVSLRIVSLNVVFLEHNSLQAFQILLVFSCVFFYFIFMLLFENQPQQAKLIKYSLFCILLILFGLGLFEEMAFILLSFFLIFVFSWLCCIDWRFDKFWFSIVNPVSFSILAWILIVQVVLNEFCYVYGYGSSWIVFLSKVLFVSFLTSVLADGDVTVKIVEKIVENFKQYRSWSTIESKFRQFPFSTYKSSSFNVIPGYPNNLVMRNFGIYNRMLNTSFFGLPFINSVNGDSSFLVPYKEYYEAILHWKNENANSVLQGLSKDELEEVALYLGKYQTLVSMALENEYILSKNKDVANLLHNQAAVVQLRNEVCQKVILPKVLTSFKDQQIIQAIQNSPDFNGSLSVALATDRSDRANLVVKQGGYNVIYSPNKINTKLRETLGLALFYTPGCIELSTSLGDKIIQDSNGKAVAYEHKIVLDTENNVVEEAFENYLSNLRRLDDFNLSQRQNFKQEIIAYNIKEFVFVFQFQRERILSIQEEELLGKLKQEWVEVYNIPLGYIIKK